MGSIGGHFEGLRAVSNRVNKMGDVVTHCFFFSYACSIEMPEMFILTGGYYISRTVSRYSMDGWMEDLPELNEARTSHGCGYFYNDDMQRVNIVKLLAKELVLYNHTDHPPTHPQL